MENNLNISVADSLIIDEAVATMNTSEVKKILERMLRENLPVPAVLVTCCFIDAISKDSKSNIRESFVYYIETKMPTVFEQFSENDTLRKQRLSQLNCKSHARKKRCSSSVDILYNHIRCGLVHNYFQAERGVKIINKPNRSSREVIVDQSENYKYLALVLNAPAFVREFIDSLG